LIALLQLGTLLAVLLGVTAGLVYRELVGVRRDGGSITPALPLRGGWGRALLVVTLVFVAANQLLLRGKAAGIWDVDGQFYPYFVMVADHARAARLVSWDPWSNGGLAALGDPQVGAFFPLAVLVGVWTGGTSSGFVVYWLLVWWLGGVGVLVLGRRLGAPAWGAAAVALGFLFCGVYTGNAEHTSWLVAYSFLPLIIWRLDVALETGRLRPAVEAGALWGLGALGGHPAVVMITGAYCGLWALGRSLLPPRSGLRLRAALARGLLALLMMSTVGLVVLAPAYVAFFVENAGVHPRVGGLSRAEALLDELQPGAVATFASPYLGMLKAYDGDLWPASDVSMVSVYAGAIVSVLALYGLLRRPTPGWRWWILAVGLLQLAAAMGESLPLRGWLYDALPPMRYFRHSAVFRLYFVFSLCVLALDALRDVATELQETGPRPRTLLVPAVILLIAAGACLAPFVGAPTTTPVPRSSVLLGFLHFASTWTGLVAVALVSKLLRPPVRWRVVAVLLLALASADALLTAELSKPTMRTADVGHWRGLDADHVPALDLTTTQLSRTRTACPTLPVTERCRQNDQLITKRPVLDAYATEKHPFHLAMLRDPVLLDAATGDRRTWFSSQVVEVSPTEQNFAAFVARTDQLGSPPLVVHRPEALLSGSSDRTADARIDALPPGVRVDVRLHAYSPSELRFEVDVPTDGWLLVTDRWGRSWRATVNGVPAVVYGGNFIFRALQVAAGRNQVAFTFEPFAFPWLVVVSWGVLLCAAAAAAHAGWCKGE
jgi:hypothetical protein